MNPETAIEIILAFIAGGTIVWYVMSQDKKIEKLQALYEASKETRLPMEKEDFALEATALSRKLQILGAKIISNQNELNQDMEQFCAVTDEMEEITKKIRNPIKSTKQPVNTRWLKV